MSKVLLALQDKSLFQVVFSYLNMLYLFQSVQFVSRFFYEVVPVLIEALDPCVVYSIVATKGHKRQRKQAPVNYKSSVLEILVHLGARCSNLRFVDFGSQTRMTIAQLSRALARCSGKLEAINFARCLQLACADVQTVLRACPRLQELNLARTHVTTETLAVIASHCPHIETLNLRGCDGVTDGGLAALSRGQLRDTLAHLDLTSCKQISDAGVRAVVSRCHALETLLLRWSTATPDVFAYALMQCPRLLRGTPAGPFNVALSSACHADADRGAQVRVNVRCDLCSTILFGTLSACEVVVSKSSRKIFKTDVLTDTAPSSSDLSDVSHIFAQDPRTMRNCPNNCHFRGPSPCWLMDSGSGFLDLKGKKHCVGCGPSYGRIEWMQSLPRGEIAVARGGWMIGRRSFSQSGSAGVLDVRSPLDPASCVGALFSWRHSQSLRRVQDANTACSSKFYTDIFKAAGKLPHHPHYRTMSWLVRDQRFTGCADDYVDDKGSTLLGYCLGPVNDDSVSMLQLLMEYGGSPTHRNDAGLSAMAYAKAWRDRHSCPSTQQIYEDIIGILGKCGCPLDESNAF